MVQLVQSPPSGPLDPLLHVQSLRALLPWLHEFPTHVDDRAGQPKHMLDVGVPEVLEYLPIPHSMHVLDVVAPTAVEYVPIAQ